VKYVQLITDGSSIGNRGPEAEPCILRCADAEREMTGHEVKVESKQINQQMRAISLEAAEHDYICIFELLAGDGDLLAIAGPGIGHDR
jgi:hypothetical protein